MDTPPTRGLSRFVDPLANLLIVLQVVLCGIAVYNRTPSCADCISQEKVRVFIGLAGITVYAMLLILRNVWPRAFQYSLPFVTAAHGSLIAEAAASRTLCVLCATALVINVAILSLHWRAYRPALKLVSAALLACAVTFAIAYRPILRFERWCLTVAVPASRLTNAADFQSDKVNVIVYISHGCEFCDRFVKSYDPEIRQRLDGQINLGYRHAHQPLAGDLRVPTLIIGRNQNDAVVLEGLPSFDLVHRLIQSYTGPRTRG